MLINRIKIFKTLVLNSILTLFRNKKKLGALKKSIDSQNHIGKTQHFNYAYILFVIGFTLHWYTYLILFNITK